MNREIEPMACLEARRANTRCSVCGELAGVFQQDYGLRFFVQESANGVEHWL